jgi:thiol-disulfide isomerase/thioredoxin
MRNGSLLRKAYCVKLLAPFLLSVALVSGNAGIAVAGCGPVSEHVNASAVSRPLAPALQGKTVVARIHADWCPACKATEPTIEALRAKYGSSINFVEFDVTDAKTSAAAAAKARQLGLSGFYEANKNRYLDCGDRRSEHRGDRRKVLQ